MTAIVSLRDYFLKRRIVIQIQNPKIPKVDAEIERIQGRISKLQSRLEELRGQRADMYNADLLTIIKDIPPDQLCEFVRQMKAQNPIREIGCDFTV